MIGEFLDWYVGLNDMAGMRQLKGTFYFLLIFFSVLFFRVWLDARRNRKDDQGRD